MTRFKLYKHDKCIDVAFRPKGIYVIPGENITKVRGWWINVHDMNKQFVIESDEIMIKDEDMSAWKELK